MMPLYAAVFHGCEAGKHQLVFDEVYWLRINKGDKTNLTNLGTFSADLAALSSFFQQLWSQPIENLREDTRLAVMDSAGLCLWALGRLEEAAQLFKTTCAVFVRQGNLDQAARITNNLSAIYRMLGDLKQALGYGRQAVRFAEDNSNAKTHAFRLIGAKVTLADALYQFGEQSQARKLFEEAEDIEREKQKHEIPFLYGREGYQYCDFLLNQGDYQTVQRRTRVTLRRALNSRRNRHVAFDRLSFGRAYLVQAQMEGPNVIDEALNYLHKALNGLREVGMEHHLPPALLAFAELYQFTDDLDRVQPYIDEAMRVATRGNMRLYVADCLLQYARLFVAQGEKQKARESWEKAKEMIEQMGYGRRKKEVEEIERLLEEMAD
jgi:tetratricopeptide (TPR) repeat protein